VRDGQAAIADKGNQYFAAVLTDYHMPCLNGLDFLNWLKSAIRPLLPFCSPAKARKMSSPNHFALASPTDPEKPVDLQKLLPASG
jgi:CheY-like chemotaxis protein